MQKMETIAATMKAFMSTHPSVADFPSYKALNDHVGSLHGLPAGKCQALAGPKAWAWHPDTERTGTWRPATEQEVEARRTAAANKVHGTRGPKVLSDADRAALDAQVKALQAVNNPALAPLLAELQGKQAADDNARRGTLKDRLAAAVEKTGLQLAVDLLEKLIAQAEAEMDAEDGTPEDGTPEDGTPEDV